MSVSYIINNIYQDNSMDRRTELFNQILSKIILVLESLEDDWQI